MPEDVMLHEAVEAIRQGERGRARDLLTRLLRADSNNLAYWLWMSSVVETQGEQIYCLKTALKLDPESAAAQQGLRLLGALPAEGEVRPVPPPRRKWTVATQQVHELSALGRLWANPYVRLGVLAATASLVFILVGFGVYYQGALRRRSGPVLPTRTAGPSPTFTLTPTAINETPLVPTAIATQVGPRPLWAQLEQTYTPTPIYVNTPHVANESFQLAQRAFGRGDLENAMLYLRQAEQINPEAPDIPYLAGEIYRQQNDLAQAIAAYKRALDIEENFAPALLGLARAEYARRPETDVTTMLEKALHSDPNWSEPYLVLAGYLVEQGKPEAALETLAEAPEQATDSPMFYRHRAQAHLALGENKAALEDAQLAHQLDVTALESYRLLAYAAAANDDYALALEMVDIYLTYEENDPQAWMIQGRALFGKGDFETALQSLEKALAMDKRLAEARLYRGLTLMKLGKGPEAINEIYLAQQSNPRSFVLNLYLAQAMLASGRLSEALQQVNRAYDFARGDVELGQALFWRAQVYEAIGNQFNAIRDWKLLVDLPGGSVPTELIATAQAHITTTSTPAPTATTAPSSTPTPKITHTTAPTRTPATTQADGAS